jgi:hypothetical protein
MTVVALSLINDQLLSRSLSMIVDNILSKSYMSMHSFADTHAFPSCDHSYQEVDIR